MAENPPDCRDVIASCDKAIEEKNKALTLANLAIKACIRHGTEVQLQLNEKTEELDRWYRNPLLVGALGIVVGGVAFSLLNKNTN